MFCRVSMFGATLFATHYGAYHLGKKNLAKDNPKGNRDLLSASSYLSVMLMATGSTCDNEVLAMAGLLLATHSFAFWLGSNVSFEKIEQQILQQDENKRYPNSRS
jgi:hypothetical protein